MGDMSVEPSMEEILSSIKRIIAEEGDGPAGRRRVGKSTVAPAPVIPEPELEPVAAVEPPEEILELSDPMPSARPASTIRSAEPRAPQPEAEPARAPVTFSPAAGDEAAPASPAAILSPATADATRGALESLSRLVVKPEPGSDGTLEGMVREMLRPMLREWLDANLPGLVEQMVSREIARISGQAG